MKKLFVLIVSAILLLSTTSLFAECVTNVSGTISAETWTTKGSPYCVEADILAEDLVIEPGVRVEFLGNYVFEIEWDGKLIAVGTEDSPIIFTEEETNEEGWQGIWFNGTLSDSRLIHCQVEKAVNSGVRIVNSSPTIENCSITNNISENGGGMRIVLDVSTAELVLKNCTVSNNESSDHGGGIYATASTGSLTLKDCKINNNRNNRNNNHGNYYGGGIYVASAAGGLLLKNCEINANYAQSSCSANYCSAFCYGGGIYLLEGNISFENCIIDSNNSYVSASGTYTNCAYSYGAGIYIDRGALMLTNSVISNNSPSASGDRIYEYGGGIFIDDATVALENTTIAYNTKQGIYNNDGILTAINSILYFNDEEIAGVATVNYCDVEGNWTSGEGNIDADPKFENILDLRIKPDSPCVDAGDPNSRYNDTCFPPSLGTELNDIGAHGGPIACEWKRSPAPDIRANGEDESVFVAFGEPVDITVSLDPGNRDGELADWWIGTFTSKGNYWYRPSQGWVLSDIPISIGQTGLFSLEETSLLNAQLPEGLNFCFFILDNSPNGILDNMMWSDLVTVVVTANPQADSSMEKAQDFQKIFQQKIEELIDRQK